MNLEISINSELVYNGSIDDLTFLNCLSNLMSRDTIHFKFSESSFAANPSTSYIGFTLKVAENGFEIKYDNHHYLYWDEISVFTTILKYLEIKYKLINTVN